MKNLYFDYAATTDVYPELNEEILRYNSAEFYNPSALYDRAAAPRAALKAAREKVAFAIGSKADEIFFTSCATESNNWVLRSVAGSGRSGSAEIVTTAGEHASVRETAAERAAEGVSVKTVPLNFAGQVNVDALMNAVNERTKLVSLIHVSNETGAINDVAQIAKKIKAAYPNVRVHSDGVQAFGKIRISLKDVDFYSISAHKIHAPKGVGALYIKKSVRLTPLLSGGGQERGERSGTENVSGIAAFGHAADLFIKKYDRALLQTYKDETIQRLNKSPLFFTNVSVDAQGSPHILSCGFDGIRGETLMHSLAQRGVIIGKGSACSARAVGNAVLGAIGVPPRKILDSIRISFDAAHTKEDIEQLCETMLLTVADLKEKLR